MKIRTDFVTNSSSSSFTVSIAVKTVDGKVYRAEVVPDDGGGNGSANILCSAETLLNCPNVASLMDTIYDAVSATTRAGDDAREKEYFAEGVLNLATCVKNNVHSLEQIATLTFERQLHAWGEFSSCFGTNIDIYAPELCSVAQRLCAAADEENEEECEALKKELLFLLRYSDGCVEGFPSGFMGSSAKCCLDICRDEDDLVDFAYSIARGSLDDYNDDDGLETTIIDMQNKTIRHGAIFGDCSWDGIRENDSEYIELLHFVINRKRKQYTIIRQQYMDLVSTIPFGSDPIEYWDKSFVGSDLPTQAINMLGGRSTSLETVAKYNRKPDSFDYWAVNTNPPPEADDIPDCDVEGQLASLEWMLFTLQQALASGVCFIEYENFLNLVAQQRRNNYPYTEARLTAWKAGIPFDHISTISCENKIFATASLGREWLYEYCEINRKVPSWDIYPTRNWLVEIGAIVKSDITRNCNYLIVGMNATIDTPKVAKAIQLRDSGKSNIKIIPEDELLRMLNGEVLEIPEEYQRSLHAREDALKLAEEKKQQEALEKQRLNEEAMQRKAERRQAAIEARVAQEKALAEMKQKHRDAKHEAFLQRQKAEQAAKEEKRRLDAEERERKLSTDVLYRPGEEPANIRSRMDTLFGKLDEAYPDKQISGLQAAHKKWSETANEIRKLLGYPDSQAFLEAYGYTVVNSKGGRPSTCDPEAVIAELKRRYPNGGCKNIAQLKAENGDLPIKTLVNNAQKLFGMSLGDYLKEIGLLG